MLRYLGVLLLVFAGLAQASDALQVKGVRLWAAPDNTRVVFDVDGPVSHTLFSLDNPSRLVIDVKNARITPDARKDFSSAGLVEGIRAGARHKTDLRVVLDLKRAVKPKSFVLKPNGEYGHRLVIDLFDRQQVRASKTPVRPVKQIPQRRDLVIAIDAGHGGEDPGARGKRGTREKDVVLSISRRLARLINNEPGMRAVMIRDGDYYVGLRQRMQIARKHRADLFVSIHADAFRDRSVRGSSVFVLSQRGASSEMARWLAARENAADLAGGVSLDDKDDLLAGVLLDLAQSATLEASTDVAADVLQEMKQVGKVHKRSVQHAGFVVLKSPDIPSLLVETAFISNPAEEKRLRSSHHQQKIADAVFNGVRNYFASHAPPGTLIASSRRPREHVIRNGDTLSHIANRYGISMASLRAANKLSNDRLYVGKTLRIPASDG